MRKRVALPGLETVEGVLDRRTPPGGSHDPRPILAFNAIGRTYVGHAPETVVWNELDRRKAVPGDVKSAAGLEIDFLAPSGFGTLVLSWSQFEDRGLVVVPVRAIVAFQCFGVPVEVLTLLARA